MEWQQLTVCLPYNVTKLLELLFLRELAKHTSAPPVITSVNPGFCYGDTARDVEGVLLYFVSALQWILARKTEVGSRTLDAGAYAGAYAGACAGACAGNASQGQLYGGLQELGARRTDLDGRRGEVTAAGV